MPLPLKCVTDTFLSLLGLICLLRISFAASTFRLRASTQLQANVQHTKMFKKLNKNKAFTFMDSSGAFPGMGHCVEGILQAHLQARESNIRIAELPGFMNEYCEEDVAAALGTTLPTSSSSSSSTNVVDSVWNAATSPNVTGVKDALLVTRKNDVVRVPVDSRKINLITTVCSRMADLYEPKCCKNHQPCCSGVWRARFASRPDALRYCHLVREAIEGRFSNALRQANEQVQLLDDKTQLPVYHSSIIYQNINNLNKDCLPGGKKEHTLECGQLGDGSMLSTDGGRSLPSYTLQAKRVTALRKAQDRIRLVQKEVDASKSRLKDVRSLLSQTARPSHIAMKIQFTSKQPLDVLDFAGSEEGATAATLNLIEMVVAKSLYNVHEFVVTAEPVVKRLCSREHPCLYGLSNEEDNVTSSSSSNGTSFLEEQDNDDTKIIRNTLIDHSVTISIKLSSIDKAKRVQKILKTNLYLLTLKASFNKFMSHYNITHVKVTDIKKTLGLPQSPPKWYVDHISKKVLANEKETQIMIECEEYAKKLLVLNERKSKSEINLAILKENGKPSSLESDVVERLTLEIHITDLNLSYCMNRGKLMHLTNGDSGINGNGEIKLPTNEILELQRTMKNTNIEIQTVVQQGRLRASLGALSLKASRIASQVEVETSVVNRARLEAQLAELNMVCLKTVCFYLFIRPI